MRFTIDGKTTTRAKAAAHFAKWEAKTTGATNPKFAFNMFDAACEQSSAGYASREAVEQSGVTIRHPNEEQG